MRTYSELIRIQDFEGRYEYLRTFSHVGVTTFGFERWLNQRFYTSMEWRQIRHAVIARDNGCDLGIEGREVWKQVFIHHMNPIEPRDVIDGDPAILDPEHLITVSLRTHNAIHYGDASQLERPLTQRVPGDTKLW